LFHLKVKLSAISYRRIHKYQKLIYGHKLHVHATEMTTNLTL
jgi:hypothetical protein